MESKKQIIGTYKSISNWHKFRLRLFLEGILTGIFAGLVISLFRFGLTEAEAWRESFYEQLRGSDTLLSAGWFAALVAIAFILYKLTTYEPMAAGSGIPQVKGALLGLMKMRWFSVMWVKLSAGIMGIGAGLSLGREGPSIQLGAVAAQGVSRMLGRTRMEERYLLTSGASAGLAAAFNAPLAGVIFALEELHRNFSIMVLLPSMAAAMTATVISRALFGRASVFDIPDLQLLPLNYYGIVILVALVAGLAGVIFNKGLLNIGRFYALPIFKSQVHKIIFALLTAGVLGFFLPEVLGGGNNLINHLAQTPVSLQMLLLFLAGKLLFTLISYGCGVPGGFFLPMLVIGALSGSICANVLISLHLIEPIYAANIVVIAMAALFSSSVRAPITGTVLIMEMTASYQQLLTLAIGAMVAFVIAELCQSKPIYEELLTRMLNSNKPAPATLEQRNVVELAVCSGSPVANKLIKDIQWPANTLLVDIKRGEQQLVPSGDTLLMPGDFIYVFTENEHIEELQALVSGE
ncbi:ClC family H(+)/Cl(-) exchange transporter [Phascolarctobacterium sp.]|uniref:ClC family H(+)/Cl(-) exchange transporter n=1 Tax=Phascolarctobacterium sp. TaxID=2049039 RepID=UPI00386478BE